MKIDERQLTTDDWYMMTDPVMAYLVAISHFILAVEVVPDVNHAVHPGDEEHPRPSRAEAAACQVRAVVLTVRVRVHSAGNNDNDHR